MIRKKRRKRAPRLHIVANGRIRASQVLVIDEEEGALGVIPTGQAIKRAYEQDKDLVLINEKQNPPVAKIIELSKYKYQLKQKQAANRKKAKTQEAKEIRFKPFIGQGDLEGKIKRVKQFLEKGYKVKLTLEFRGRQITKKEIGGEVLDQVIEAAAEIAKLESDPKMMGKKLVAQLIPRK